MFIITYTLNFNQYRERVNIERYVKRARKENEEMYIDCIK